MKIWGVRIYYNIATITLQYIHENHTSTPYAGINTLIDPRGNFLKILPDFRRGDQGRDRLNMT